MIEVKLSIMALISFWCAAIYPIKPDALPAINANPSPTEWANAVMSLDCNKFLTDSKPDVLVSTSGCIRVDLIPVQLPLI